MEEGPARSSAPVAAKDASDVGCEAAPSEGGAAGSCGSSELARLQASDATLLHAWELLRRRWSFTGVVFTPCEEQ